MITSERNILETSIPTGNGPSFGRIGGRIPPISWGRPTTSVTSLREDAHFWRCWPKETRSSGDADSMGSTAAWCASLVLAKYRRILSSSVARIVKDHHLHLQTCGWWSFAEPDRIRSAPPQSHCGLVRNSNPDHAWCVWDFSLLTVSKDPGKLSGPGTERHRPHCPRIVAAERNGDELDGSGRKVHRVKCPGRSSSPLVGPILPQNTLGPTAGPRPWTGITLLTPPSLQQNSEGVRPSVKKTARPSFLASNRRRGPIGWQRQNDPGDRFPDYSYATKYMRVSQFPGASVKRMTPVFRAVSRLTNENTGCACVLTQSSGVIWGQKRPQSAG